MIPGFIEQNKRKKIILLCDDIRMTSGISTMAREIVIGTAHKFNWINIAGAINHPDKGKRLDLSADTNNQAGIKDSSIFLYPTDGYGNPEILRAIIETEKPDAIMFFTDPRYWIWLFQMEHEIRQKMPMIYLNIWDDLPYPMYNKPYYESCDTLMAISKQTENINRIVLGEAATDKIIKYVPHGINEKHFYPITKDQPEFLVLQEYSKQLFSNKEYKFKLLYNARNIRRKSVPDLMLAWKLFIDQISDKLASESVLVLHTQGRDEHGTDLFAVKDMLFGNNPKYNIIIDENKYPTNYMNLMYNACDAVILPSSNEGWGLSLTEGMMCGKPIIANVTGGMQDQMRFENNEGEWIKFTEKFGSNHRGKYTSCGVWAIPVFPNNISIVGSLATPYIFDDRVSPEDLAKGIRTMFTKKQTPEYTVMCELARDWVTSDEAMMTAKNMCLNVSNTIEETLEKFTPRHKWELIEVETPEVPKHYVKYPVAC